MGRKMKPRCNCWKYERQVCDICQRVTGKEKAAAARPQEEKPTDV